MKKHLFRIVICIAFGGKMHAQIIRNMSTEFVNHVGGIGEDAPAVQAGMSGVLGGMRGVATAYGSLKDLIEAAGKLDPNECAPNFSNDLSEVMMATCDNDVCNECYEKAVRNMNFYRMQLARASCIYQNTKTFTNAAISFGDNASGIHAVSGIAWQKQRGIINESFNKLKATYDTKSAEFLVGLGEALIEFSECERQFGQPDWYQKSGFIYFEFMKERYKRLD
jgi:hypothetical protein